MQKYLPGNINRIILSGLYIDNYQTCHFLRNGEVSLDVWSVAELFMQNCAFNIKIPVQNIVERKINSH